MKIQCIVKRYKSQKEGAFYQTYTVEAGKSEHILTVLDRIKWTVDGTLTFRKNCRNVICGSCSMRINGSAALACKQSVEVELKKGGGKILIEPMGNMPVVKDLVVDMGTFWNHLEDVRPWLETKRLPEKEHIVSKSEREHLSQMGNCIMCGACYSDCNSREVEPRFLGPAALAKAYRYSADSRDSDTKRLKRYNKSHGIWDCTHCFYCVEVCPMDVAPMEQILRLRRAAQRAGFTSSRGAMHHNAFVKSIRQSGWLNEVTLPVASVGYSPLGMMELAPVGLRMLLRGKMPHIYHPAIEKVREIRRIYKEVKDTDGVRTAP